MREANSHRRIRLRYTGATRRVPRFALSAWAALLVVLAPLSAQAQQAQDLFAAAQTKERQARVTMASPGRSTTATLKALRAAVAAYEKVAAQGPKTGYADTGLWLGGELAADAFGAFGQERDRQTALRLLRSLVRKHPDSAYVAKAKDHVARVSALVYRGPAVLGGVQQRFVPGGLEIGVEVERAVWFHEVRLTDPPRLYFDLYNTRTPDALRNAVLPYESGPVTQVRLGHHPNAITRIVLDGHGVDRCTASFAASPSRLVVFCRNAATRLVTPAAAPDLSVPPPSSRALTALLEPGPVESSAPTPAPAAPLQSVMAGEARTLAFVEPPPNDGLPFASAEPADAPLQSVLAPDTHPLAFAEPPPNDGLPFALPAGVTLPAPVQAPSVRSSGSVAAPLRPAAPRTFMATSLADGDPQAGAPALAPLPEPPPVTFDEAVSDPPASSEPGSAGNASVVVPARSLLASRRPGSAYAELAPAVEPKRLLSLADVAPPERSALPTTPLLFAEPVSATPVSQRPTVQLSAAAQVLAGDPVRLGSQRTVEPDLGVQFFRPGSRLGNLFADLNVTRRDDRPVLGRGLVRLDGLQAGGLRWSLDAGDTWASPVAPDFGFANLFAPPVNLRGVSLRALNPTTALMVSAANLTARRNIFGTDTLPTGQRLAQIALSHRPSPSLDLYGRASDVRGTSPVYASLVEQSTEAGGGLRYRPSSSIQLVADAGYSAFRRTGSDLTERDASALVGATWAGTRGWLQVNASRLALGHYAVGTYPYNDRTGVFAAFEWSLHDRVRLFGGSDFTRTGLDPTAAELSWVRLPQGTATRGHGGVRLQLGNWSSVGVRVDAGGREIAPSKFGEGFSSDTGVVTADWNLRAGRASGNVRYERRSDVDAGPEGSGLTQHDATAQVFYAFSGGGQIFGQGLFSQRIDRSGEGQTLWQAGGGSQVPLGRVFVRFEGTVGRTRDWFTRRITRRESLSTAVSGRIADDTYLSLDVYVDHTPFDSTVPTSPWVARTMLRLTRSFAFGASRTLRPDGTPSYRGPTGRVTGIVFADWNGDGVADLDEEPVPGVRVMVGLAGSATGGRDGRFTVDSVPTGDQVVSLDLSTVPATYDPPEARRQVVPVASKGTNQVLFGLVPLGSIQGVVYLDVDGDNELTPPDTPITGAVLVLDDGARTEVTRDGRFWIDNVRIGTHSVNLIVASLEEGSQLSGPASVDVALTRDEPTRQLVFLVKIEKRAEIRKVFAPKKRN